MPSELAARDEVEIWKYGGRRSPRLHPLHQVIVIN